MKAIEFSTSIKDGVIKVPKQFWTNLTEDSLRVIILVKEPAVIKRKLAFKKKFKAIKIDTRGFKFNRAEANER